MSASVPRGARGAGPRRWRPAAGWLPRAPAGGRRSSESSARWTLARVLARAARDVRSAGAGGRGRDAAQELAQLLVGARPHVVGQRASGGRRLRRLGGRGRHAPHGSPRQVTARPETRGGLPADSHPPHSRLVHAGDDERSRHVGPDHSRCPRLQPPRPVQAGGGPPRPSTPPPARVGPVGPAAPGGPGGPPRVRPGGGAGPARSRSGGVPGCGGRPPRRPAAAIATVVAAGADRAAARWACWPSGSSRSPATGDRGTTGGEGVSQLRDGRGMGPGEPVDSDDDLGDRGHGMGSRREASCGRLGGRRARRVHRRPAPTARPVVMTLQRGVGHRARAPPRWPFSSTDGFAQTYAVNAQTRVARGTAADVRRATRWSCSRARRARLAVQVRAGPPLSADPGAGQGPARHPVRDTVRDSPRVTTRPQEGAAAGCGE